MNIGNIYAGLQIVTPPAVEPLQVTEIESYLRVAADGGDNDADVSAFLTAARKQAETILRRALLTQTWKLALVNWPGRDLMQMVDASGDRYDHIKLPFPPLQSVTSVNYRKSDGSIASMVFANYAVIGGFSYNVVTTMDPGRIVLPFSGIWPTEILMPGAPIEITFVAGYANMSQLQAWEGWDATAQSIKMLIADCWENRIPPTNVQDSAVMNIVRKWLAPFRIHE